MKVKTQFVSIGLLVVLVAAAVLGCAGPATPGEAPEEATPADTEVIEWRHHSCNVEERYMYHLEQIWSDMVYAATDGQLKVTLYPVGALGHKDADMLRVCGETGAVESFFTWPGYTTRDAPSMGILQPEMVFTTRDDYFSLRPFLDEEYATLYDDWGIRLLAGVVELSCDQGIAGREPYDTLESMEGKKIRTWSTMAAEALKKLDIAGEVMSQADLYLALKTNLFDGAQYLPEGYVGISLWEVTSYFSTLFPLAMVNYVACSEDAFQALPPDVQEAVLQASAEFNDLATRVAGNCGPDRAYLQTMVENGVTILPDFSADDRKALSAAATEVWQEMAAETGPEAVEYQQRLAAKYAEIRTD